MDAQVAPEALDRVITQIAIAAEHLERAVDNRGTAVARQFLGHRGKAGLVRRPSRDLGGGQIEQRARRLEIGRHVSQLELGVLELGNGFAELLALLHIDYRLIKAALRPAQRAGADVQPAAIEPGHGKLEAVTFLAHAVGNRHAGILEHDLRSRRCVPAQLAFGCAERDARRVLFDDKARNALGAAVAGSHHDDVDVIISAAGNELLGAVQHIVIAFETRGGGQRGRVRSRAGFGQAVPRQEVHRHEARQVARLELGRTETVDHPGGHVVDRDERARRRAAIGHGFHDQRRFQPPQAIAA